jgi:hypothetical protein
MRRSVKVVTNAYRSPNTNVYVDHDRTTLNLLTLEGMLTAIFEPALTTDQAEELAAMVRDPGEDAELRLLLESVADAWGLRLVIER